MRDWPSEDRTRDAGGGGLAPFGIFGFGMRLPKLLSFCDSITGTGFELTERLGAVPYDLALLGNIVC